ncbi:MAG: leucine-rich repeat protein [Oscillospiraceae bacterium]
MIASLLPATALAADIVDSGTCGAEGDGSNLTWTLDSDGVLTISGSGDMHGYGPSGAPWHGRVKSAVIAEGVTSIGGFAFYDCTSLTSVTIPDSVTSIGANAFFDCTSLTSVTIPDSVTSIGVGAFASCTSLTGIWVAESNSHYSSDASGVLFNKDKTTLVQCPGAFAAYTIPNSVTSIGDVAFSFCTSLASVTIPDSVTSIGRHAFQYCTSLTSVTIPNGVTSIGDSAFSYCASLTSVTIPDSVTSIGWSAFAGCTSLTSVTIPDSVTSIGSLAFSGCTSLTSVTVPDSVTSIGDAAFASCTSLTGIWVAEGSSHYASDASGVLFNKDKTTLVQCPGAFSGSYAIPDSVTSIGHCAFEDCASLTSVTIPDSVTSIGHYAFEGCRSLTDVYFTGTESAWNSIAIGAANDALKNANIHYNYVSHTHSYKDVVTAPTCTTKGYTTHTCACGDSYVDTYVDALGHAWDNGKVTKEPTETESGVKTFTCTRCGETKTETIPKLTHEHSYKAVVTAPTCTSKGYTTHTCACGDSYVDAYVDALGHAWDNGKVTKEPTETETGVKTFACTRCGETKTETIPATGSDVDVTEMFSDVTKNWAYPGIQYCVTHQLMSGVGGNLFAPKMTTTRAQIVQILYNLEGEPKVSGTTPFTDLTQNWYKDAVLWAYQTGVVSGTSATTFAPDLPVTREQIAVILMEYMTRVLKLERTWTPADLSVFPDAGSVSGWAKDALADAVALGLISGASNGGQTYLNPQGSATREQVATILMNFCQNVKK